jgi:hypothetical protein
MDNSKLNTPHLPNVKNFGYFFTSVFFAMAIFFTFQQGSILIVISLASLGSLFFLVTLIKPQLLSPINIAWFELGMLMGKIVSPIALSIVFFLLITPVALVTRVFGRDELKLNKQKVKSYWVERNPIGPDAESFKNQY